jgi:outer membrane protein assembly factor BamB
MLTKKIKTIIVLLSILLIALLSGCTGSSYMATSWPGVTADDTTAYVASGPFIYAVNLQDGTLKWKYPADKAENNKNYYAAPALTEDGQLIVGSYDHSLYSFNPKSGSINWSFSGAKNLYIASPLVSAKGIFAPNADGNLYALDFKGTQRYVFETKHPLWANPATDANCECIFLASMDHKLYSVDADTGKQQWVTEDLGGALVAPPAISADGTVYVGTFGNEVLAIDGNTGAVNWRFVTNGWVWSGIAFNDGALYFGDLKGNFYSINSAGEELWRIQPDGPIVSQPSFVGENIVFTTEAGSVYSVDKDGNPVWNQTVGGKIYGPAILTGDSILVAPIEADALLVSLTSSGVIQWSFTPAK